MARKTITREVVVDDLTGVEIDAADADTVQFTYRGRTYEIDLGPQSREQFDAAVAPFISAARPVVRRKGKGGAKVRSQDARAETAAIRANGHDVAARGRIGADVVDAYRAAYGQPAA